MGGRGVIAWENRGQEGNERLNKHYLKTKEMPTNCTTKRQGCVLSLLINSGKERYERLKVLYTALSPPMIAYMYL